MQSDPMWGTCMAMNVYFVIFRRWDSKKLKQMFKWYILVCYGVPFIPAMFCLWYQNQKNGRVYGDATVRRLPSLVFHLTDNTLQLWCWIDNQWQTVRIYSYYGPIWCYILVTFLIYIRVGYEIFRKRSALRAFGSGNRTHTTLISQSGGTMNNRNSWNGVRNTRDSWASTSNQSVQPKPFTGTRTTEVEVTHSQNTLLTPARSHNRPARVQEPGNFVDISTSKEGEHRRSYGDIPRGWYATFRQRLNRIDRIKLAYTKCAILFAMSILITWVPSSANRVYSLTHQDPSYALNLASAAVLPLQGFWNTTIFFWTSWNLVKEEYRQWRMVKARRRNRVNTNSTINIAECEIPVYVGLMSGGLRHGDTESTREVLDDDMEIRSVVTSSHGYTRNNSVSERATSSG